VRPDVPLLRKLNIGGIGVGVRHLVTRTVLATPVMIDLIEAAALKAFSGVELWKRRVTTDKLECFSS